MSDIHHSAQCKPLPQQLRVLNLHVILSTSCLNRRTHTENNNAIASLKNKIALLPFGFRSYIPFDAGGGVREVDAGVKITS